MNTYKVVDKNTGDTVFQYKANQPLEWSIYLFSKYNHIIVPETVVDPNKPPIYAHLIDIGPFFDRFGPAKMAVLTSENPSVKAIIQDAQIRKWIDLTRPDVIAGVNAISALVPEVTSTIVNSVLSTIVYPEENLAVRAIYFKD